LREAAGVPFVAPPRSRRSNSASRCIWRATWVLGTDFERVDHQAIQAKVAEAEEDAKDEVWGSAWLALRWRVAAKREPPLYTATTPLHPGRPQQPFSSLPPFLPNLPIFRTTRITGRFLMDFGTIPVILERKSTPGLPTFSSKGTLPCVCLIC